MSKSKTTLSKKQSKKNLWIQITVIIVLIGFAAYFIPGLFVSNKTENTEPNNIVNNPTAFSFSKEGELSFVGSNGKFIARIDIEVADDNNQREQGLMFRDKMDENQGMLFIFDSEAMQAFWMRNTVLPLDIIYINSKMEIVHIAKNAKPFDETSLPSVKPAQYVVEVNAGYCDKLGIKEGCKIVWRRE